VRAAISSGLMIVVIAACPGALASAPVVVIGGPRGADVVLNGRTVIHLQGLGAPARAAAAARRLDALRGPAPPVIAVMPDGLAATLWVNGTAIISVDRTQAALRGTVPRALAQSWGRQIRAALPIHLLTVSPSAVTLHPGERLVVAVGVFPRIPVRLSGFDRRTILAGAVRDGIAIAGREEGSTAILIHAGRAAVYLSVAVRPASARLPANVRVSVTGNPADPDLVRDAIRQAILRATKARPGSQVSIGVIDQLAPAPGQFANAPVRVTVRNPLAAPVDGTVYASVANVPMDLATPARLLISNRPETVVANGVLFAETLRPDEAVRLLYHHTNGAASKKVIAVTLANPGEGPATVFLTGATAGPSTDVMYAGSAAADRFVRRIAAGQGYLLEIAPHQSHTFSVVEMTPGALVTGLLQVQLRGGSRLTVTVHIRSPWLLERTVTSEVNQTAYAHPRGAFRTAEVKITRTVRSGERVVLTDLGFAVTPDDPATGERLAGDYGILYRLTVELVNQSDREAAFTISAQALSGPSRGMLLVAGTPVDFGLLRIGEERALTTIDLAAGESRTVEMLTMPAAGSFYPVRLTMRGAAK
jgi:hypothetical protein